MPFILVLGCGSIGRRHAANLRTLGRRVRAFDPDPKRRAWVEDNLQVPTVDSLAAGLRLKPAAVWVCTPPSLHAAGALAALSAGAPCFIEKPLAHSLEDARAILAAAKRARLPVAVGYQLRGHPALRELKKAVDGGRFGRLLFLRAQVGQYLPDWRPWQDYRKSYTAKSAQGGGVILDASHELDLARWLGGEPGSVYCSAGRLSGLKISAEDTAAAVLHFRSGALGEVHLDMVSRPRRRNLELCFERGTMLWDLPSSELKSYDAKTKRWSSRRVPLDLNSLYLSEARAFLSGKGFVTAEDAAGTLALALAARRSAKSGRRENVR